MYDPYPIKIMPKKNIIGQPTLNGKPINITDSWSKMTFSQYLRTLKLKDDTIELISILTRIDYDYLKKAQIKGLESILLAGEFLKTAPKFPEKPTRIGKFKLPLNSKGIFDIQMESLAQFEDMRQVMNKTKPDIHAHTEAYATYCALYLQKLRDGEYDGETALKMIPELMEYPASDIITAGGFFFVKLRSLLYGTASNSPSTARHRRKSIGKRSSRSLVRTQVLTKRHVR